MVVVIAIDNHRFVVRTYTCRTPKITHPHRYVFLTDLHGKEYDPGNARLLDAIRAARPECIFIGGDMIVGRKTNPSRTDWYEPQIEFLRKLKEEFPLVYANGNHELKLEDPLYCYDDGACAEIYERELQKLGISRLRNAGIYLGDNIHLYAFEPSPRAYDKFRNEPVTLDDVKEKLGEKPGLVSVRAEKTGDTDANSLAVGKDTNIGKDLFDAKTNVAIDKFDPGQNGSSYTIVLSHHPQHFKAVAQWGADLVLSGHYHGGIWRFPGTRIGAIAPDPRIFPRYTGGTYWYNRRTGKVSGKEPKNLSGTSSEKAAHDGKGTEANPSPLCNRTDDYSEMILSCGIGQHTLPIRMFNPAELTVIDLVPDED